MNTPGDNIGEDGRKKIILFDTTLRDGHQCPGAAVEDDKNYFNIVRGLDGIGFDICEVGFPASSKHEEWRVNKVAQMCRDGEISTMVCGLTGMVDFQVESCLRAIEPAIGKKKAMLHIYFPVDPVLRQASIGDKVSDSEAVEKVARFTKMAVDMGAEVQFSGEGYSRQNNRGTDKFNFTSELIIASVENGARWINCPDTIGGEDSNDVSKEYFVDTMLRHKQILDALIPKNNVIWSVHNHNDIGTAVENSMNAIKPGTGISKIEGTVNGIGERAGNAAIEEVIVRILSRLNHQYDIDHINTHMIGPTSKLVAEHMLPVQPNKAVVGSNASKHTSGGHANAMINDPTVYQPFDPTLFGNEITLVYGPNSGGNLAIDIIEKQGYICDKKDKRELDEFLKARMQETGRYKGITDQELLDLYIEFRSPIKISGYTKNDIEGSHNIQIIFEGEFFGETDLTLEGETVFTALRDFISKKIPGYKTGRYSSKAEGEGSRAILISNVPIRCEEDDSEVIGIGKDTDIETSSLKALANAFNQIYVEENYKITKPNR